MEKFVIKRTPIQEKKEFVLEGHKIKYKEYYPATDTYVYERYLDGELTSYEVVRPVHVKQDGGYIDLYPSSKYWGEFGMTVWKSRHARKVIDFLVGTKDWTPENIHRFKQSL